MESINTHNLKDELKELIEMVGKLNPSIKEYKEKYKDHLMEYTTILTNGENKDIEALVEELNESTAELLKLMN